ncbi:iron-sulfur cluster assembly scaffold protein [Clostridiaceae bacterium 35-E11]
MDEYTQKVFEHFRNPRNVGVMDEADGIGKIGSEDCGDYLVMYIKVDENEFIEDIKFQIYGCVAAIATSSALTEMAKGMHIDEAVAITEEDIIKYLGGLPEEKIHCSVLGAQCIKSAVLDYYQKKLQTNEDI